MWSSKKERQREEEGRKGKRKKEKKGGKCKSSEAAACPKYALWNTGGMQTNQQSKVKKQEKGTCWKGAEATGGRKRNDEEEQKKEEAQEEGNEDNNKHEEEECNLSARVVQWPSWPRPLEALSGPSSGPQHLTPPQNCHCSSCAAVHGMLLPVPNRQRWPPLGQPHPMPAVQPPAQHFLHMNLKYLHNFYTYAYGSEIMQFL